MIHLYNRYLADEDAVEDAVPLGAPSAGKAPALSHVLSDRIQNFHIDRNTILVMALCWFLLADDGEPDTDLLILVGVLLFLGI